jgi:hypothetical protein
MNRTDDGAGELTGLVVPWPKGSAKARLAARRNAPCEFDDLRLVYANDNGPASLWGRPA